MDLKGKSVLFLGSSVTYGEASGGVSFAEIMAEACEFQYVKEAVSGTTLVDIGETSYISRLKKLDKNLKFDLFVCQLSTNDARKMLDIVEIEKAIRFIIQYVEEIFQCPIFFYTGTYFESAMYEKMIQMLYELQKELSFDILDLYHDQEMSCISEEQYKKYMRDPVHPTLEGYREWWTPKFIEFCRQLPVK